MSPWAPPGYLDAASGLPLGDVAQRTLRAALAAAWADPDRRYDAGRRAGQVLATARAQVADDLACRPEEVRFAASGAAALAVAVAAVVRARPQRSRLLLSAVERMAAFRAADVLAPGVRTTVLPVDAAGAVLPGPAADAVDDDVAAVLVQSANIETGTVHALSDIAAKARACGAAVVVDGTASLGWPDPPTDWDVLVGHAPLWGGPAGVGVLAIRTGTRAAAPWPITEPERGFDLAAPPVALVAAAAAALTQFRLDAAADAPRLRRLTDSLAAQLAAAIPDLLVNGDRARSLPHVLNISILYADAAALVDALNRAGLALHSGSACTAETERPSHVLTAMGALTHGNLRISLPVGARPEDVEHLVAVLPPLVTAMRRSVGL